MKRKELADKYIQGDGIEIGALCYPLSTTANVVYIDRFDRKGLHKQYPDIQIKDMVLVNVVADGETLEVFENNSKDFIIANHFLEHCANPIKAIKNWVRVLKPGGVIFCAVPNKNECFDKDRETTSYTHLVNEFVSGNIHKLQHYKENGVDIKTNYSIHYHCWDQTAINEFMQKISDFFLLKIEESVYTEERVEFIFVLRKVS